MRTKTKASAKELGLGTQALRLGGRGDEERLLVLLEGAEGPIKTKRRVVNVGLQANRDLGKRLGLPRSPRRVRLAVVVACEGVWGLVNVNPACRKS